MAHRPADSACVCIGEPSWIALDVLHVEDATLSGMAWSLGALGRLGLSPSSHEDPSVIASYVSIASPNRDVRNHPISEKKNKSAIRRDESGRNQAGVSLRSDPLEVGSQVVIYFCSRRKKHDFCPRR